MGGTIRGISAAALALAVAACGSAHKPPPTPYQRYAAAIARAGLHMKEGQAGEVKEAKRICSGLASAAEDSPDATGVIYPATVTALQKDGYTETQASAVVRAVIADFCPQWKMLLRQGS
jgi:hypothetical protein